MFFLFFPMVKNKKNLPKGHGRFGEGVNTPLLVHNNVDVGGSLHRPCLQTNMIREIFRSYFQIRRTFQCLNGRRARGVLLIGIVFKAGTIYMYILIRRPTRALYISVNRAYINSTRWIKIKNFNFLYDLLAIFHQFRIHLMGNKHHYYYCTRAPRNAAFPYNHRALPMSLYFIQQTVYIAGAT